MNPSPASPHTAPEGHVSAYRIARSVAGDLTAPEQADFDRHVQACEPCRKVVAQAREEAQAFAARHPSQASLQKRGPNRGFSKPSRPAKRRARGLLDGWERLWDRWVDALTGPRATWAMATAALGLGFSIYYLSHQTQDPDMTAKGRASYYAFVNGRTMDGDTLICSAGDTVQFGIVSPEPVHYALLYRDDDGALQAYFTPGEAGRPPVGSPQGENLPSSLVLDSQWKRETIYALASPKPFNPGEARARIEAEENGSKAANGLSLRRYWLIHSKP